MKHFKKLALAACAVLAFGFAACSSGDDSSSNNNNNTNGNGGTTYIGTKAPSEAKAVGDIVFSDGSATPYASDLTLTDDQKAKAIAVIFYVGTELNSGDDTTTSRTLGVGLAHNKSGLAWCTNSANAYSKNITTIQCPASGSAGALTFTGDKNGSDNLSQIGTFLASNSSTDDTATADNYPAFYFAKNYASQEGSHVSDTDYASDWYLPTIAELFQIWKSKETVDAASKLCGGSEFGSDVYWSSSQYAFGGLYAVTLYFFYGSGSSARSTTAMCVRFGLSTSGTKWSGFNYSTIFHLRSAKPQWRSRLSERKADFFYAQRQKN